MSIVTIAAIFALISVLGSTVAVAWRLLRGPSSADRVISLDMIGFIGICVASLLAVLSGHAAYLSIALGIAFFGFLAALALAGFLERGSLPRNRFSR